MKKLALISSHPVQYNAPLFRKISESDQIELKVFYTWSQRKESLFDKDFGAVVEWDIPLFDGYEYTFVKNEAKDPGLHHFKGLQNPTLVEEILDFNADAVLVYGWNYASHYKVMKYFKGKIPVYFRGDSTLLDETPGVKTILRRVILSWIYRKVDVAFYVGKNNKAYFEKHGLKDSQLVFAPHAIDNDRFMGEPGQYDSEAKQWRKQFGVADDEVLMLFVGKFEPKKNPLIILDALERYHPEKLKMVFVGSGNHEAELKKRAASMKNIQFLPFQNQSKIPGLLHASDVMILPSQGPGETWGLIVNEAMVCKNAIIVSDKVGCSSDLVNQNGVVFRCGAVEELTAAIKAVACNKEVCSHMAEASFKDIKDWSYQHFVEAIERVLQ